MYAVLIKLWDFDFFFIFGYHHYHIFYTGH